MKSTSMNFRQAGHMMPLLQNGMAERLRSIANLVEGQVHLSPRNLKMVEDFLSNFPMPKISSTSCPSEDFSSRCAPEVLEHILHFLPPRDLKSAVMVNKKWYEVGGKPKLWSWCKLRLQSSEGNLPEAFAFLKRTMRIRSLEAFSLSSDETAKLMAVLAENTSLEEVGFDDCSMEEVKPGVLSSAVSDLGKVHLENLTTTGEQMTAFFSSATSHCKLSSLIVAEVDLSGVAPDLLSTAAKLMELYMNNILLTPEQTRVLWTAIEEESNFSSFQFAGVNLANVNLEALAKVARRAVKIDLGNAALTADQANAVVIALAENEQIQEVDLSDNSLTDVEPGLLVRALAKTRKLNLANTSLTTEQVKQLLESLLSDNCAMENLDFSANILSMIEPDLMAKSLNKLKVVTLLDSNISVNQVGNNIISCN